MKHLLAALVPIVASPFAVGQSEFLRTNPAFVQAFRDTARPIAASVVRVQCNGNDTCLGIVVGSDGWILTKAHDLTGKISCRLRDRGSFPARLVGVHEEHDLAMLKIEATDLKPVAWTSSHSTRAGAWVASVGQGDTPAAVGVVSVPTRKVNEAYLGVMVDSASNGLVVLGVLQNGAAMKAGVQPRDVIGRVNGQSFTDPESFSQYLAGTRPGDTLTLHVRRGDQSHDFRAVLQSRNDAGGYRAEYQNRLGSDLSSRRGGYTTILQHDTVLRPIDCGSPLVDLQGRVLGMNISRAGRVETWAIPSETIRPLLADLKAGRPASKIGR